MILSQKIFKRERLIILLTGSDIEFYTTNIFLWKLNREFRTFSVIPRIIFNSVLSKLIIFKGYTPAPFYSGVNKTYARYIQSD